MMTYRYIDAALKLMILVALALAALASPGDGGTPVDSPAPDEAAGVVAGQR
ncbi:MAG: hypothetical protein ACOC8B_02315 [Gemmatimonadota bacterium]